MSEANQRNKAAARAYWNWSDSCPVGEMADSVAEFLTEDVTWRGFAPLENTTGRRAVVEQYLAPLHAAFPDLTRQTHIAMGGVSNGRADGGPDGRHWVGGTGYLTGTQTGDLWGIPARNRLLRLRWGEFLEFDAEGRIITIEILIDVIDWLEQIDMSPLPASRGVPFVYPAPTGIDGRMWDDQGDDSALMAFARQFIFGGLNAFDESDLKSMGMADYFHPNLKWYGPGGIGACLSLEEFQSLHQAPWLKAFPDRKVGDLENLLAEGDFVGASSLPGVYLTHTGPYLGHTATGLGAGVNGIDFWRFENGQFTENWVFVDMLHLFSQFGIDLMARVRHMTGHQT
ncbi:MAG: ester cyclase [Rhodobacteraceae bacterium]|nr:ester cyclase [Paracoccaceae bacterium]